MTLVDFTGPGLVLPRLLAREVDGVLRELTSALQRYGGVADAAELLRVALDRERLTPTDLGDGLAMPHARLPRLRRAVFALGRSPVPLAWGATPGSIRLVFLSAVPMDDAGDYLQLISGVARLSRERDLLAGLLEAPDEAGLLAVLQRVTLRGGGVSPGPARSTARAGETLLGAKRPVGEPPRGFCDPPEAPAPRSFHARWNNPGASFTIRR